MLAANRVDTTWSDMNYTTKSQDSIGAIHHSQCVSSNITMIFSMNSIIGQTLQQAQHLDNAAISVQSAHAKI